MVSNRLAAEIINRYLTGGFNLVILTSMKAGSVKYTKPISMLATIPETITASSGFAQSFDATYSESLRMYISGDISTFTIDLRFPCLDINKSGTRKEEYLFL